MNEELQRKLAARRKLSGGDEGGEGGSNAASDDPKRASAPGRLAIPAGMGRFNPAAIGGVPSPFAMMGGGSGGGGGPPPKLLGGQGPMSAPGARGGGAAGGAIEPLPSKPAGPAGRRKPTNLVGAFCGASP